MSKYWFAVMIWLQKIHFDQFCVQGENIICKSLHFSWNLKKIGSFRILYSEYKNSNSIFIFHQLLCCSCPNSKDYYNDSFFADWRSVVVYISVYHHQITQESPQLTIFFFKLDFTHDQWLDRHLSDSYLMRIASVGMTYGFCMLGMWSQKCFWVWQDLSKIWFM